MDFNRAFQNKNILVPILQRDYVQGATESIIVPFLDQLLESDSDLNYIYGYDENGSFVPVDGQQRLITLWLLYLYVYSRKQKDLESFSVVLNFQAREFATEFCNRLSEKLPRLLASIDNSCALDKKIMDQNWFITSWSKNATVKNMLSTLRYLHKKINAQNIDAIYNRLFASPNSAISFAFLDMTEENGLDDDIYIKMNGRGRPLSAFENLKSWMDQQIKGLRFEAEWKGYMDNRWTNLFWQNRNKTQEHPEEIDDEQLHMFCNLMVLFHVRNNSRLLGTIAETSYKEELREYLGLGEKEIKDEDIYNKILSNLTKGLMMPLVWLERLTILPPEFFNFAYKALNALSGRFKEINDSGLYFGGAELSDEDRSLVTRLYELSMTGSSFGRTLPLLYSAIIYKDGSATRYYDWLRVTRNLILNRESKDGEINANLQSVMICLESFAGKAAAEDIFEILGDNIETLNVFSKRQIQEEILKAKQEMHPYHTYFAQLENLRFFSGRIGVLFKLLPDNGLNAQNITDTVNLLSFIFNGGDNGITARFDNGKFYLRRILMSYHPFWYGFERNRYWSLCSGLDEWRRYVRGDNENIEALTSLVHEFAPKQLDADGLYEAIKERVEDISKNYLTDISTDGSDTFKYHFIHHPGVWSYMNTKLTVWGDNPFDIVLKKTDSNNSRRMELRTYCLYLDYCHIEALKAQYEPQKWEIWCYEREDTCFNLQRSRQMQDGVKHTIAIDVFFRGVDGKRDSENCYGLNVFVRTKEDEDAVAINSSLLLSAYEDLFQQFGLIQDKRGRFVNSKNLSRKEIIEELGVLLSKL